MMNIAFYNHKSKCLVRHRVLHDCHPGMNRALVISPLQSMYGKPGFKFPSPFVVLWHEDDISVFSLDLKMPPPEIFDEIGKLIDNKTDQVNQKHG